MMKLTPTHKSILREAARTCLKLASGVVVIGCAAIATPGAAEEPASGGFVSDIFANYWFTIVFVLLFIGLLVYRKKSSAKAADIFSSKAPATRTSVQPKAQSEPQSQEEQVTQAGRKSAQTAVAVESDRQQRPNAPHADTATQESDQAAFGAYRIDQEVGKLVLGKPHRMDVMASRVADDRRAIEASLIKALSAPDASAEGRRRARQALEEYGFVARQSALMLQGRDAWERSSAARVLGQIGSSEALPSLVEALHDNDSVVRNQAVTSLGQLKQPAAIGALLDIARRHSDIPPSLLSESLSSCSVDSLGYLDSASFDLNEPGTDSADPYQDLEPLSAFEELPSGDEDDALLSLVTKLESPDVKERAQIARELGMHQAQRSVSALCATALHDSDPSVRSAAVTALGAIDHESVFAPVLIALADETREVRAAAARTLSSLHFDRAAAYARVMETADQETLQDFAKACVTTGIVPQGVDRLASEDRRQAHEAFSLFSVLAKAGQTEPIFDVIENHKNIRVRLAAVRVLGVAGTADAAQKLRELVAIDGMPEDLRTSMLEALYKLDREPAVA